MMRRVRRVDVGGWATARCLYCGHVTGGHPVNGPNCEVATVCNAHLYSSNRDETREVAAGMTPWQQPLSFWVLFFGMRPMSTQGDTNE